MRFALIINETAADLAARDHPATVAAWQVFLEALTAAGAMAGGAKLAPPDLATTVRLRDGQRDIQDGPFAETKELLGGFILIEVPGIDEALRWAVRCPTAATGSVEVRPVMTGPA
jgi:hypothetical protein